MKTAGEWREEARRRFLRDVVINYSSAHACGTIQDAWDWAIRAAQEEMREECSTAICGDCARGVPCTPDGLHAVPYEGMTKHIGCRAAAIRKIEVK